MRHETKPQLTVCPPPTGMAEREVEAMKHVTSADSRAAPRCMIRSGMSCVLAPSPISCAPSTVQLHPSPAMIPSLRVDSSHHDAPPHPLTQFTNQPPNLFLPIRLRAQGPSQDLCGSRTPAPKSRPPKTEQQASQPHQQPGVDRSHRYW